jgi:ketosteroid isomerase-like protein
VSAAIYRQALDAWNERDVERFLTFCHPQCEMRSIITQVEGGSYRGHDGVRRYFADLEQTLEDPQLELVEIEERGEWVIASHRGRARGTASGAPLEWEVTQAARFQDGLCVFSVGQATREAALAAAGLE